MPVAEHIGKHPRLLGRREVAARLGVSPQTVTRWAQDGLLPFVLTLGGQRRYPKAQVEVLVSRLWEQARFGSTEIGTPRRRPPKAAPALAKAPPGDES